MGRAYGEPLGAITATVLRELDVDATLSAHLHKPQVHSAFELYCNYLKRLVAGVLRKML